MALIGHLVSVCTEKRHGLSLEMFGSIMKIIEEIKLKLTEHGDMDKSSSGNAKSN